MSLQQSNSSKEELLITLGKASFLLRRTYQMVQEQKLFLSVFQLLVDFYEGYENYLFDKLREDGLAPKTEVDDVMKRRLLYSNKLDLKRIMGKNFDFSALIAQKSQMQELLEAKKEGPADFARKKDYIICEKNYKVRVINESSAQKFLQKAEEFGQFL